MTILTTSLALAPFEPANDRDDRPALFVNSKVYQEHKSHLTSDHYTKGVPAKGNLVLGLNIDSEFQCQSELDLFNPVVKAKARQIVTIQVSDFLNQRPVIFAHPDLMAHAAHTYRTRLVRHPQATSEFIAVDYLRSLGFDANITCDGRALSYKRTLTVILCGFFAVVDTLLCFQGDCLAKIVEKIVAKKIVHQRVLKYVPDKKDPKKLRLPYFVTLNGEKFALVLDFIDLLGAQGKVSLKDFCANVGVVMEDKNLAGSNITRMMEWYFEDPQNYDAYAGGDLFLHPAWMDFNKNIFDLSSQIISPERAVSPSLTIGSTTNRVLDARRLQYLGICKEDIRSSFYLRCLGHQTFHALDCERHDGNTLLKVDGGRCRNNHPTLSHVHGSLCDMDLKGAYSSAMMFVPAFFGSPSIEVFKDQTLGQVLDLYLKYLLPHHWTLRLSTREPLSFEQDLISSFYDYKWKDRKTDTESYSETGEFDYNSGASKIFSKEILQGTLTSDLLDVILHTWTRDAREEFFKKVTVHSLGFYDPRYEIKDLNEFVEVMRQEEVREKALGPSEVGNSDAIFCQWHKVPLSSLGIEAFREERKKHPKMSPLNILYKLLGNTAYGAIVSHFFPAQNPIVANNITAHIRVAVYLAEKALGFYQTITDGGLFNLNEVLTPKRGRKIFTDRLYHILSRSKRNLNQQLHLEKGGLGGHRWRVEGSSPKTLKIYCDNTLLDLDAAQKLVNDLSLQHVRNLFPILPLLQNPFIEFEMKAFFNRATLHGSSNYGFWYEDHIEALKMRGYERKAHVAYFLNENNALIYVPLYTEHLSPARWVHEQLGKDSGSVDFPPPFIKNEILKTAPFANYYEKRFHSPIKPGDNLKKMGAAKWFSLNQHTFQTKQQFENWQKVMEHLLRQYKISFELFYLNDDGTLNYDAMIQDIHMLIKSGLGCEHREDILNHFDLHENRSRLFKKHSSLIRRKQTLNAMTARIADFYAISTSQVEIMASDDNDLDEVDEFKLK